MSFRVLVIPEDPTNNGYILKPLVEAILSDAQKPNARVTILTNPRLNGYDQAVASIRNDLPDRYAHWDLWIFMPDADRAHPEAMQSLENEMTGKSIRLFCCPAKPEVEIFACVGHRDHLGATWETVRTSSRMKELYFDPLLKNHGDSKRAGSGRDLLIKASLSPRSALYQFCPELALLRDRCARLAEIA